MEITARAGAPVKVIVRESGDAGAARRAAAAVAGEAKLNAATTARVALVATEMANNLLRHAVGGEMIVRALKYPATGVELLAIDHGPGIVDIERSRIDGFSTAGTSGAGMGAMERQSDEFDLFSTPGAGTVSVARIYAQAARRKAIRSVAEPGVVSVPMDGETVCGDGWGFEADGDLSSFMLVDGLGHGPLAAGVADAAHAAFQANPFRHPAVQLEFAHASLHGSRGAAMAFALLDRGQGRLCFAGVGNIAAVVITPRARHNAVSRNGIVGFGTLHIHEEQLAWSDSSHLILHSDGLTTRWTGTPAGLFNKHPAVVAGALYRDFKRGHDDVTVLVAA